jgi:hypothetical protein
MGQLARNAVKDALNPRDMMTTQGVSLNWICVSANIMPTIFVQEITVEIRFLWKACDYFKIFSILSIIFYGPFFRRQSTAIRRDISLHLGMIYTYVSFKFSGYMLSSIQGWSD